MMPCHVHMNTEYTFTEYLIPTLRNYIIINDKNYNYAKFDDGFIHRIGSKLYSLEIFLIFFSFHIF